MRQVFIAEDSVLGRCEGNIDDAIRVGKPVSSLGLHDSDDGKEGITDTDLCAEWVLSSKQIRNDVRSDGCDFSALCDVIIRDKSAVVDGGIMDRLIVGDGTVDGGRGVIGAVDDLSGAINLG